MSDGLMLSASDLESKFGFGDGGCPDELLDLLDARGLPYPTEWRDVLVSLVRTHLLPLLPGVETYTLTTSHNPIRCRELPDGSTPSLPDVSVVVPWEAVIAATRGTV